MHWSMFSSVLTVILSQLIGLGCSTPTSVSSVNDHDLCLGVEEGPCTTACANQVKLGNRCFFKRNYNKICFDNLMCKTRNAFCLDNKNKEVIQRMNGEVLRAGRCLCPQTHNLIQTLDECQLMEQPCKSDDQCGPNFVCQSQVCVCRYEYHVNHQVYLNHCLHNKTTQIVMDICPPGVPHTPRACLPYYRRSDLNSAGLEPNWTLTLWKLLVLSSILVSLLLLARRIKRAQRYDERIRSMYYQREAVRRAFIYSSSGRTPNFSENTANPATNSASVDLPPTYDEAVKQHVFTTSDTQSTTNPISVRSNNTSLSTPDASATLTANGATITTVTTTTATSGTSTTTIAVVSGVSQTENNSSSSSSRSSAV